MKILKSIIDDIFKEIKNSGLKLNYVAEKIGITRNYLSLIKHGKRNPSQRVFDKLCKIINRRNAA
jgi:transcriptional regulator with XRE-family HTH domain